jgi:hypothetical protein
MAARCPSCGTEATGKFCGACGASLAPKSCPKCGQAVAPGARFCAGCGTAIAGGTHPVVGAPPGTVPPPQGRSILPVAIAGVAVIAAVLVLVTRSSPAAPPDMAAGVAAPFAGGGDGTPPDLSQMSPRDQFDRLYNRIMTASEQGDTATANRFSPMALMAYQNLPEVDQDARYHAAMLRLHGGDIEGAQALADSIGTIQKGHLFSYVLNTAIARFSNDQPKLKQSYEGYLDHLDAEMAAGRSEYQDHKTMLDNFTTQARAATGRGQ